MADNIKILMTADTVGGVWTYTIDLCKALEPYGVTVYLMTMGALVSKQQNLELKDVSNIVLYESNYKLEWMQDAEQDVLKAKQWVQSAHKNIQPHLLHFNNFGQTANNWNCPVVTVYHSCVQTWWQALKGERPPQEWDWYTKTLKNAIKASDIVVAPSAGMLEQAESVFGKFDNSAVIYNGRDLDTVNYNNKQSFIITAGRVWDEGKNIKFLCDVAQKLPWLVYVAGNNKHPDTGVEPTLDNVKFLGQLNPAKLYGYMQKAAIFVMPAKYEPFGLAILEAAKASCALVLSDIPTLREIWGDAALYFNPVDSGAAKNAITRLTDNATLRQDMALKAQKRAREFTAKRMAAEYFNLYKSLLQ